MTSGPSLSMPSRLWMLLPLRRPAPPLVDFLASPYLVKLNRPIRGSHNDTSFLGSPRSPPAPFTPLAACLVGSTGVGYSVQCSHLSCPRYCNHLSAIRPRKDRDTIRNVPAHNRNSRDFSSSCRPYQRRHLRLNGNRGKTRTRVRMVKLYGQSFEPPPLATKPRCQAQNAIAFTAL